MLSIIFIKFLCIVFLFFFLNSSACDLENVCDNVAVLIRALPPGLVNQDKFCFLLKEFETQQVGFFGSSHESIALCQTK